MWLNVVSNRGAPTPAPQASVAGATEQQQRRPRLRRASTEQPQVAQLPVPGTVGAQGGDAWLDRVLQCLSPQDAVYALARSTSGSLRVAQHLLAPAGALGVISA